MPSFFNSIPPFFNEKVQTGMAMINSWLKLQLRFKKGGRELLMKSFYQTEIILADLGATY